MFIYTYIYIVNLVGLIQVKIL